MVHPVATRVVYGLLIDIETDEAAMTLRTTELTLFASTIATGLGFALVTTSIGASASADSYAYALIVGAALLLLGQAAFVGTASRAVQRDRSAVLVALAAFAAGVASVWFWLGPAQTGFLAVACEYDHFGACEIVAEEGGYPAHFAHGNDDFVVYECELKHSPEYCRIAAAKRLSHPAKFCPTINSSEAFEVVEWCTPNMDGTLLVARR